MSKNIVMMIETLTNEASCEKMLQLVADGEFDNDCLLIFNSFDSQVDVCRCKEAWDAVKMALKERPVQLEEVPSFGFLEFLQTLHEDDTVFLSPMVSFQSCAADIALLNTPFKKIYVYLASSNYGGKYTSIDAYVSSYAGRRHVGMEGLDRKEATHGHKDGDVVLFTLNDVTYSECIPSARTCESGAEGFTFVSQNNPEWRVKIWDSTKQQFSVDKVSQMVNDRTLRHPDVAFPEAIVYNTFDEPIGFVMRNFEGTPITYRQGWFKGNQDGVCHLVETVMFLSSRLVLHPDMSNNLLMDKHKHPLIIDLDSVQYHSFPACSYNINSSRESVLPTSYVKTSLRYSHVELSYSVLSLACSAFILPSKLFINKWENGLCMVNRNGFRELQSVSPALAHLFKKAYMEGTPVDIASILFALKNPFEEKVEEENHDLLYEDWSTDFPRNEREKEPKTKVVTLKETVKDTPTKTVVLPNGKFPKTTEKNEVGKKMDSSFFQDDTSDQVEGTSLSEKQPQYIPPTEKVSTRDIQQEKESFLKAVDTKLKEAILHHFGGTTPMCADLEESWNAFVEHGAWKKPLFLYGGIVLATVVMVIACLFL